MPTPQEVIDSAQPGDTVKITLRGPANDDEKQQLDYEYHKAYPHLKFIIEDGGLVSSAEIVEG